MCILCIYYVYQFNKGLIMKKLVDFRDLTEIVQTYANENCEGNFSLAVRVIIKKTLSNKDNNKGNNNE